ncbi:HEAT repeat domain-containing protein, partial [Natronoarchaeum mannanilyticum]
MTDPDRQPSPDRPSELLSEGSREDAIDALARLETADADARKRTIRTLQDLAETESSAFDELATPLTTFLNDEERAIRLTTAKLFVALARSEPAVVRPVVDALAARSADDEEFYYVRARCAEALGYVALDHPDAVSDPELLADLRVRLSFDEPEVREKLAKALAYVAIGDPSRLRHQVSSLAEHLDDDSELVRYYLCTALAAIGCDHPSKLADARDPLGQLLDDERPYVRGRAAEALGLLARSGDADIRSLDGV